MKKIIYFFLRVLTICFLPVALSAQPTISTNEFYYIGDVIRMMNCPTAGFDAGASGANINWDFSGLNTVGDVLVTTIEDDTTSGFSTSTLLITLPSGIKQHVRENNTDSYLMGITDTGTGMVTYYVDFITSKRPIHYLSSYVDTYQVNIPDNGTYGTGHITTTVDAYGTLELPTGTYNDVLRVKKVQSETDTTNTTIVTTTNISYLWFDTEHSAPLLRIDSTIGVFGADNSIRYLMMPTAIKGLGIEESNYQCYLHNNELVLTGNFVYGKNYEVAVYNIIGAKFFNKQFISYSGAMRMNIDKYMPAGIYFVSIIPQTNVADKEVIKVIKQ